MVDRNEDLRHVVDVPIANIIEEVPQSPLLSNAVSCAPNISMVGNNSGQKNISTYHSSTNKSTHPAFFYATGPGYCSSTAVGQCTCRDVQVVLSNPPSTTGGSLPLPKSSALDVFPMLWTHQVYTSCVSPYMSNFTAGELSKARRFSLKVDAYLRHDLEVLLSHPISEAAHPRPSIRRESTNNPEVDEGYPSILQNQQISSVDILRVCVGLS